MLNPGPNNNNSNNISVMYHNVQGLIPFSNLGDKCPNLDQTKIFELKSSITINKPDVIILNETWLKESILEELSKAIKTLIQKRGVKKFILIGDFNFPHNNWDTQSSNVSLEQDFLNMFAKNSLIQTVHTPTHRHGNILDLLLTSSGRFVDNIHVLKDSLICKSDHFPITFDIMIKFKRNKGTKREIYNFKKANWDRLNSELANIDWTSLLDYHEPESAWANFSDTLKQHMQRHIPIITVKSEFKPFWFDAECHHKCKEKEKLHKKFKRSNNLSDGLKFATSRREFKKLIERKMRDNLCNEQDPNLISKKFWSHIKSSSKTHRILEVLHHGSNISYETKVKANMFNKFFFDQFSDSSTYNVNVDFTRDNDFDIDFSATRVHGLLNNIDVNKASGPDDIPGIVLKKCSNHLAYPLSLIFKLIYNTGIIPTQWKLSNVVPIHKKGDDKDVRNYRPISF